MTTIINLITLFEPFLMALGYILAAIGFLIIGHWLYENDKNILTLIIFLYIIFIAIMFILIALNTINIIDLNTILNYNIGN